MKIKKTRSIQQIINDQINKWKLIRIEGKKEKPAIPVITISRQPGSNGHMVAKKIADELNLDLFDQEIIQAVAESAHMRASLVETLDEKGVSALEDMIAAVTKERHLWAYEYLHHLMRVIGTIGKHGHAVILGRGANFILPREEIFRVRIIAPLEVRIENTAKELSISWEEAKQLTIKTESDRKAFIRKYFNADIDDSQNYDLVINTENLDVNAAVESIKAALRLRKE
ncbi:MAG: cytidylate kinase-like family protein [Deltaproteobacteria bacterium]|nr:MAG: cytidylate kinase-like family protein [Deltaproteobacteria bacterium]